MIATVNSYPRIGVANINMKNVPAKEELPKGGFTEPWIMNYPAQILPSTFYFDQ